MSNDILKAGTVKRLHVDRRVIARNAKVPRDKREPPITVQTSKGPIKCWNAYIKGPSEFIYAPEFPLPCGAKLYIKTYAAVYMDLTNGK